MCGIHGAAVCNRAYQNQFYGDLVYVYSGIPKWNPGLCLKLKVLELAAAYFS